MKKIKVVAGVLFQNSKILIGKRPEGFWEFPGGKIETHETPQAALIREFQEELKLTIKIEETLMATTHAYETFEVFLTFFKCEKIEGEEKNLFHKELRWVEPQKLKDYEFLAANQDVIEFLVQQY